MPRLVKVDETAEEAAPRAPMVPADTVRIVIADQSPIFRDGLRRLLAADARLSTVADTHLEALVPTLQTASEADVLLLGAAPSGSLWADSLGAIASAGIAIRTILLAASLDLPQVTTALHSGASGVVAKDSTAELLFKSIDAVMAGHCWIGAEPASRGVAAGVRRLDHARRHAKGFGLTRRELDIIRAVLDGDTNRQIAVRLTISENTVKRHLMHTYNKMGVSSRVELALFAAHHRILDGI
jgi:two-component system, NarL family, nitrate/nitrite response regulator NarL